MSVPAYPLRLIPVYRDYLWGGRKLESHLNKSLPSSGIWAESWEVVDHPEHESVIANGFLAGKTLGQVMRSQPNWLVGNAPTVAGRFPLLLKYLDCQRDLSVQVHPDDLYGLQMQPPDLGKTEAWYILHAEPNSMLYAGLKEGICRDQLAAAVASGKTAECLHTMRPQAGDCVFIPAGTVHALGAGLIVAEIQQASNTTFRLYDWDRVGADGKARPLHVEQCLQTIDFESGPRPWQTPMRSSELGKMRLVECDKFCFDRISDTKQTSAGGDGRFHILTVPKGRVRVITSQLVEVLELGQTILLPACHESVILELDDDTVVLQAHLP